MLISWVINTSKSGDGIIIVEDSFMFLWWWHILKYKFLDVIYYIHIYVRFIIRPYSLSEQGAYTQTCVHTITTQVYTHKIVECMRAYRSLLLIVNERLATLINLVWSLPSHIYQISCFLLILIHFLLPLPLFLLFNPVFFLQHKPP